jgi:uncharacterized protein YndB with AHSA1/START domain
VTGHALTIERRFRAPAQRVFEAFTSPEVMRRWWHPERDWATSAAEVDLRVGGAIRVVMGDPRAGTEYGAGGTYTEVDPPRRVAFTWQWDDVAIPMLIEIDFEETDAGTVVRFTHSGLPDDAAVRSHDGGWNGALDNLGAVLAGER